MENITHIFNAANEGGEKLVGNKKKTEIVKLLQILIRLKDMG